MDQEDKKDEFPFIEFLLWLLGAFVSDFISLIPYAGVLVSWPFAAFFTLYKIMKGINYKKVLLGSGVDFVAEGVFSTLPANIADVVLTYVLVKGGDALEKTGITEKIKKQTTKKIGI
ncbi:MAG: hypothetical protein HYW34_03580 [Candidatus Brennerbacteria bacterium]|nr:hypothetical protein [Candidatus Brennerbacteria bacterium]